MLRPLVIAAVAGLAISGLATLVAGRTRGGVIATALLVATMVPYGSLLAPALVVVAIAVGAEGATHHKTPLYNGGVINSLLLTIAAVTLLLTVVHGFSSGAYADAISDVALDASPRGAVTPETDAPDIVMFMLDGFPGDAAARLATAAGSPYDADLLPNALTELGFHVQRNSHSNYLVTPMTLASVFNMRHLDAVAGLADGVGPGEDGRALRRAIATGSALDELHRTGYSLTWIDSGFADAEVHRVDRWVDVGGPTELEIQIMATTALGDAVTAVAPDALSGLHRRRVEQTIGTAVEIAGAPHERPQFVFAHVPAPHAPWVFGPSGESARESLRAFGSDPAGARGIGRDEALRRVFGQAQHVAALTTAALKTIVSRPDPPVVILFSDHGPGTGFNFVAPFDSDLVERSSNFLATFTPGRPDLFEEVTTPVNLFPTLLNGYLGDNVPRSSDDVFAWGRSAVDPIVIPPSLLR